MLESFQVNTGLHNEEKSNHEGHVVKEQKV